MLLSLPRTHICKSILFLCKFGILAQNQRKHSGNGIYSFSLSKYDSKAIFLIMINSLDIDTLRWSDFSGHFDFMQIGNREIQHSFGKC